jgi:hypothetical protein
MENFRIHVSDTSHVTFPSQYYSVQLMFRLLVISELELNIWIYILRFGFNFILFASDIKVDGVIIIIIFALELMVIFGIETWIDWNTLTF